MTLPTVEQKMLEELGNGGGKGEEEGGEENEEGEAEATICLHFKGILQLHCSYYRNLNTMRIRK